MNGFHVALRIATCMLAVSSAGHPVRAANSQPSNAYVIELELERGGKQVATPRLTIASGKPAQISLLKGGTRDRNLRIQMTASPAVSTARGQRAVRVDLVVLELLSGAWVVVGEPSLTVREGKTGHLEVAGGVGAFGLTLKATPTFDPRAAALQAGECPKFDAQILPLPRAQGTSPALRADPGCCSIGCHDGSGRTMTCCGAIECCDCGSCCRPPGD